MKKILVVDDEPALLKIFEMECEQEESFQLFTAISGQEALKIINKNKIDIILTDLTMPKMDGIKLLESIKELGIDIPLIMIISGLTLEQNAEKLEKIGISRYFEKPYSIQEVISYIKSKC